MSRRARRWALRIGLVVLVAAAAWVIPTVWLKPWSIDVYYARVFARFVLRHPMMLTSMGMIDDTPFAFHLGKLDDLSPEFTLYEAKEIDGELAMLRRYDRRRMDDTQRLSAEVLDWFLDDQVRDRPFLFHDYPINQMHGMHSALLDFMITQHPLRSPRQARAYVERLSRFGVAVDQILAGLRLREQRGILPPRWVLERSLEQMHTFADSSLERNSLVTHFDQRADSIRGLDAGERDRLRRQVRATVSGTVLPAWRRMIAECERLERIAPAADGVWHLPDGDRYYDWCLRHYTTSDLPADSVHALGLREVDRIESQMRTILNRQGYRASDLAATLHALQDEPRFQYPANDSGRAAILADYQRILDDASVRVGPLFDVRPTAHLEVRRVPSFREPGSAGAYYQAGSFDGKRPGVFYANLRDPHDTAKPGMRTLAYHEGIPGHHFQISIAQELRGVPFFRRVIPFTAYIEGWALYAERLALENGFQPTPYDSLGALQAEIFRAVRLVVDTGIHRDRWTKEQAIDYMVKHTGMTVNEVTAEVERYCVTPGQACAYKVGQLEILRLRQRAMDRLGPRFDIKQFHDVVLTNGALPLTVLDQVVDQWIERQARGAAAAGKG